RAARAGSAAGASRQPTRPTGWAPAPGGDVPRRGAGPIGRAGQRRRHPGFSLLALWARAVRGLWAGSRARTGLARVFPMSQRPYLWCRPPARSRLRCDLLRKPHNFGMLFQIAEDLFAIGVGDLGVDLG